jgi:hypothetical protein
MHAPALHVLAAINEVDLFKNWVPLMSVRHSRRDKRRVLPKCALMRFAAFLCSWRFRLAAKNSETVAQLARWQQLALIRVKLPWPFAPRQTTCALVLFRPSPRLKCAAPSVRVRR